ncbi:MAG: helix-turn-helix transcriptional regulator [Eubacteriales bacterium]|nr:helix-turn-helix transcriptional regulator [Eubacteriales bacterium]
MESCLSSAIEKLTADFKQIHWKHLDVPAGSPREKTQLWPGEPDEEVMICVADSQLTNETFHRQDFFFFNFAYRGDYDAISYQSDNRITIHEGECYIGQPYAGYAISGAKSDGLIVGVLIQTDAFFKKFLHALSADAKLFRFFLEPQTNEFSDAFIRLRFDDPFSIHALLDMMIVEYANRREDTQAILQPMALTLMMQVARQYRKGTILPVDETSAEKIVRYMNEHTEAVTLKDIAAHFSYHPNYVSTIIRKKFGKTFSEILLTQRMERAEVLLKGTKLPIEEIAFMLGYSNSSNFYKAFREYFHAAPREYADAGLQGMQ